jgi:hypothetical protein
MNTLSAEQLAIVGLFIAALLEPVKLVPWITSRKFLPIAAIAIGIILAGTVLREDAMSLKEVFFSGIIIGLTAIGGRSASQAVTDTASPPTGEAASTAITYPPPQE